MSKKDNLFNKQGKTKDFIFDEAVVEVFPDMINRSVPGYGDIIQSAGRIAQKFVQPNTKVFDIGCSLGATSLSISRALPPSFCKIIAIDSAQAMVERCKRVVAQYALPNSIEVKCEDANHSKIDNASLVCMNFVLQFISKECRQALLNKVASGTNKQGALLLSEKIRLDCEASNALLIDLHHAYKKDNGYSELEIAQKRAALENVMLTDTIDIHKARLIQAGFSQVTVWFQHYNFISLLAVK